jgi:hypothetical protein
MPHRTLRRAPALALVLALITGCNEATDVPDTGVVRGTVSRVYSNLPVAGAVITAGDATTNSDQLGRFQLAHVRQGPATITVSADLYRTLARDIEVSSFQTFDLQLTPVDTVVAISGRVEHRLDGPLECLVNLAGHQLQTDLDGRWTLGDVPIGPQSIVVDHPPYNLHAAELLVHSEGQVFTQTVTRDSTTHWLLEHDAHIFTRDDSLNANRGHLPYLLVTEEFGRTALFSLDQPAFPHAWAALEEARLRVHAAMDLEDEEVTETVTLSLSGLTAPFLEGAVDFFLRPDIYPVGEVIWTLAATPALTAQEVDILPAYRAAAIEGCGGVGLGIATEHPLLRIVSTDHPGDPAWRPQVTFRHRF